MNVPGTVGDHNWSWRFGWDMIDGEATRVLALITAASGRSDFALARLP
jgi:4-alpha-glucanotransferase